MLEDDELAGSQGLQEKANKKAGGIQESAAAVSEEDVAKCEGEESESETESDEDDAIKRSR
jgi:hypothetical protein